MKAKIYSMHQKREPKRTDVLIALLLTVIASISLSILSISHLEWEERISISRGTYLFLLGLVFFTSLFTFLNNALLKTATGQKINKKYKLTASDIYDINNKLVSTVQALFSCLTGLTICLYSCRRDLLQTSHYISEAYAWFGAAYFFYDIWSMYKAHCVTLTQNHVNGKHKSRNNRCQGFLYYLRMNPLIVGHHIFIGGFGFLVIMYFRGGLGDCVFGFVYLMEASTPFVSLRKMLSTFGLKDSNLYIVNGLVMMLTFVLCRIAMFPYLIYLYADAKNVDYLTAIGTLPRGCKVSICILLFPQFYWFNLMLKGATKVLRPKKTAVIANIKKRRLLVNSHT